MLTQSYCLPLLQDDGGGGGGGDGWGWERTARNVLPNLVFLGMYFAVTSWGGDGWNGNFFGECLSRGLQVRPGSVLHASAVIVSAVMSAPVCSSVGQSHSMLTVMLPSDVMYAYGC